MARRVRILSSAGVVALAFAGCPAPEPYRLRVHVMDEPLCEPYDAALREAVEFWSEHDVDAFTVDGCVVDDFRARPMVRGLPGVRGYTTDLEQPSDHIPVYAVEEILLDTGRYNVARPVAVGLPSHIVPCPGLVASTVDGPIPLAHELGHLLWLAHSDDPSNLMHEKQDEPELGSLVLSSEQIDFANGAFDDCWNQRR